jgi:methylated-DNA-[protein]-cysteine S-methyltransferase
MDLITNDSTEIRALDPGTATLVQRVVASPVGPLRLVASDRALVGVYFPAHVGAPAPLIPSSGAHAVLDQAADELAEYFCGTRTSFSTPLAGAGTPFQRAVWRALADIPFGGRLGYAALAARIGRPAAHRAVGAANGRNPLSIFVPCHRVVGADGSLTGYAGGLPAKRWLLAHEALVLANRGSS